MYFAQMCIDTTVASFSLDLSSREMSGAIRDVFTKNRDCGTDRKKKNAFYAFLLNRLV